METETDRREMEDCCSAESCKVHQTINSRKLAILPAVPPILVLLLSPESSVLLVLVMAEAFSMAPPPHCHNLQLLTNFHIQWASRNQVLKTGPNLFQR